MKPNWKKNATIFILSQAISLFGSAVVQYAIMWHITLTTQSGTYATIFILCGFLPTLLLSPFAGVWADRYNRKALIALADGGIALSTLILAVLFLFGYDHIWLLFVVAGIRALGGAVQSPCISAILPDIVPVDQLTKINSFHSSTQSLVNLFSPVCALLLLDLVSLESTFFVDVGTAALAIAILLLFLEIPKKENPKQNTKVRYFDELKEGFSYIGKQLYLKRFFVYFALFLLMFSPAALLTPLQVTRTFGADTWRLNAIEIVFSVGMMLGGLIMAAWGGLKNRIHTIGLSCLVFSATSILMGIPINFGLYLLWMGICGLVMPMFNTQAMVLLQEKVDPAVMGRVFSVMSMIGSSITPLGMLLYGPLSDRIPIEWLLIITGILMLGGSFLLLRDKPLLEAGRRE